MDFGKKDHMFRIYNTSAITRKQRFQNAVVCGVIAAVLCVIAFVIMLKVFHTYFAALFVAFGYFIGFAIMRYGKGVQIQFAVLSVVLTLITIVTCDLIAFGSLSAIFGFLATAGTSSLWNIGYRALALFVTYQNSRIIS